MRAKIIVPFGWHRVTSGKVFKGDRLFMTGSGFEFVLAEKDCSVGVDVKNRWMVIRKDSKKR